MPIPRYDANYRNQLELSLNNVDDKMETAGLIGNNLAKKEQDVLTAWGDVANAKTPEEARSKEALANIANEKYRSASRVYDLFQQLLKNSDEIIRRTISNLSVR